MNKTKKQKLKELSNKYFWEQKAIEIYLFILIISLISFAFYISSSIVFMINPNGVFCENASGGYCTSVFVTGLFGLMLLVVVGAAIFLLGYFFYKLLKIWIEFNEETAEQRAKKELGFKPDKWGDY